MFLFSEFIYSFFFVRELKIDEVKVSLHTALQVLCRSYFAAHVPANIVKVAPISNG